VEIIGSGKPWQDAIVRPDPAIRLFHRSGPKIEKDRRKSLSLKVLPQWRGRIRTSDLRVMRPTTQAFVTFFK
jgi:hypothetical protein